MSLTWPVRKVYITQHWGLNPKIYSRFGLKGHNGIDLRLHEGVGTPIYSPHSGKVIEARYDADGYGYYLKIENSKEGSILAHLKTNSFKVKAGDTVRQGQFIAEGGNTGFSTGPHLHWGYYPIPRDRSNGYSGTINQLPLLEQGGDMPEEGKLEIDKNKFEELVTKSTKYDNFVKAGFETVQHVTNRLEDLQKSYNDERNAKNAAHEMAEEARKDLKELVAELSKIVDTRQEIKEIMSAIRKAVDAEDSVNDELVKISKEREEHAKTVQDLKAEVAYWRSLAEQGDALALIKLEDLLKEIVKRLTNLIK